MIIPLLTSQMPSRAGIPNATTGTSISRPVKQGKSVDTGLRSIPRTQMIYWLTNSLINRLFDWIDWLTYSLIYGLYIQSVSMSVFPSYNQSIPYFAYFVFPSFEASLLPSFIHSWFLRLFYVILHFMSSPLFLPSFFSSNCIWPFFSGIYHSICFLSLLFLFLHLILTTIITY